MSYNRFWKNNRMIKSIQESGQKTHLTKFRSFHGKTLRKKQKEGEVLPVGKIVPRKKKTLMDNYEGFFLHIRSRMSVHTLHQYDEFLGSAGKQGKETKVT